MVFGIELGHDGFATLPHELIYRYRMCETAAIVAPSFRGDAIGSRECAPDDRLRIEPGISRFPDAQLRI
jgi:hypothetical protein